MAADRTVTLDQIAEACGVSRAAVSYALRGREGVSAEVRERVIGTARRLGYRPNPLVAAHMAHVRSSRMPRYQATLAMLEFAGHAGESSPAVNRGYLAGARQRAAELGFTLERCRIRFGRDSLSHTARMLRNRGVRGVLVGPLPHAEATLDFDWAEFATVTLGYSLISPVLHRACYDNYNGCGTLLKELHARGYRRPGLAVEREADARSHHYTMARFLTWPQTVRSKRGPVPPLVVERWETAQAEFLRWFHRYRPDAVIGLSPSIPGWLADAGLEVGADVGVATPHHLAESKISGMYQNFEYVGTVGVDLLAGQLLRNERGVPTLATVKLLFVPGRWVEGTTLRPRAAT